MFQETDLKEFTKALASKDSVPGGGGGSAMVGAIGIALGNMVGSLTIGKKNYADVEDEMKALMEKAEGVRTALLEMIDGDAASFAPLLEAYKLPKDTPDRGAMIEHALRDACSVPMDIMRTVCKALELIAGFAENGYAHAISDAGVGVVCCKAALQGASLNVFINTKSMKDRAYAGALEQEANEMLEKYCPFADEIFNLVFQKTKG